MWLADHQKHTQQNLRNSLGRSPVNGPPRFFCVGLIAFSTYKSAILARKIRQDPLLDEALNNEMVQSLETQSWKAAYIGAIATTSFFALVGFVYPVCDLVLVALTSVVAGAGANRATFYFKYRSL